MATALERLALQASSCVACDLAATRRHVVFSSGPASARVVVVGEAPGANEDLTGIPFVGRSGALLDALLVESGLDREATYVTSVVKCRPPANRTPKVSEIAACRGFLESQLAEISPLVVITLGNTATRCVLSTSRPISALRGSVHVQPHTGRAVVPTFHPAAGLRGGPGVVEKIRADLALAAELVAGRS
jgi:DNA polymerase